MNPVCTLAWHEGVLRTEGAGIPVRDWTRPAALAEARLACVPPPESFALANGGDLLTAAFGVVPFVRGPLPTPAFGACVKPAARAAFALFLGAESEEGGEGGDAFRVLRGELDDFLVCARRVGAVWRVGAFAVGPTTLTVRFEDLWLQTPPAERRFAYRVRVARDAHAKDAPDAQAAGVVYETLTGVAPDARLCLDLARHGGFTLSFEPEDVP